MIDVGRRIRDYEIVAHLKQGGMARLFLARPTECIDGRLRRADGSGAGCVWIRLVPKDGGAPIHTCTENDGSFRTADAHDVEYEVHPLVTGPDDRLVPGESVGTCRGGATNAGFSLSR